MTNSVAGPLRAGVVGLGMMGRNHVRVWDEAVEGVDLVAIADPDSEAVRHAAHGRAARGFASAEEMRASESLDLLSIVGACIVVVGSGMSALSRR